MRIAIYCRRSTDEHQADSLEIQVEGAQRYIRAKGWPVETTKIFTDDAVSRAEFKKRPGLISLLLAAKSREIDTVVLRDETRLGGDMLRVTLTLEDLRQAGCRVFHYYDDREIVTDSSTERFLVMAKNYAAELEREKTAQRTHEHLLSKARRGLNVGGRVYGYDNLEVHDGHRRVQVEYRINAKQAEVVREIFARYGSGDGIRAIAKDLNARRIPPPRAGRRGTGSWSPSVVRSMLRSERYRGVNILGRVAKSYRGGTKVRTRRPEKDWTRVEAPQLRIVPEEMWLAVANLIKRRHKSTRTIGPTPKYLLSGLARCGSCGGPMQATNGKDGAQKIKVYVCSWHRNRGNEVCANSLRRPVQAINSAVVGWIQDNVLREDLVLDVLQEVRRRLADQAKSVDRELPGHQAEIQRFKIELDRLTAALASGDEKPGTIVKAIAERERRMAALEAQVNAARIAPSAVGAQLRGLEKLARKRLGELRSLLERNPAEARKTLEAVCDGALTFQPLRLADGRRRYRIAGRMATANLFTRLGSLPSTSPTGFEPVLPA